MAQFDSEQERIRGMRNYARMLQEQSFQAPQGEMVSGIYVAPSWTQHLANALKSYMGGRLQNQAGQAEKANEEARSEATRRSMAEFLRNAQGSPENAPGDGMGPVQPARQPDMGAAYQSLIRSPDKGLQQFGMQGVISNQQAQAASQAKELERKRIAQALQTMTPQQAIAAGIPAETVKQFYESRNYGRDEVTFQDAGGVKVPRTKYGDTPQGVAPIQMQGNPFSDLVVRGPDGRIVQNSPLVQAKKDISKAGASSTNINMPDKKFYEGLGTAVSGKIEQGFDQAQSAVNTLNNANQIAASLDKAVVGPLASQRVSLARIGETLGVAGKDTAEMIANTRNVMQGLARQELAAAGQMKGQGQITESERAILRRAEAGEINDFTKNELQEFLGAIRKTARARVSAHQRNLQRLGQDPQTQGLLPFLQLDVPDDVPVGVGQRTQVPQGPNIDSLLNKYGR